MRLSVKPVAHESENRRLGAILHKPAKLTPDEYEQVRDPCQPWRRIPGRQHAGYVTWLLCPPSSRALGWQRLSTGLGRRADTAGGADIGRMRCNRGNGLDRPYQRAMSLEEIIVEVKRGRGTHFDPILADIFIRSPSVRRTPAGQFSRAGDAAAGQRAVRARPSRTATSI